MFRRIILMLLIGSFVFVGNDASAAGRKAEVSKRKVRRSLRNMTPEEQKAAKLKADRDERLAKRVYQQKKGREDQYSARRGLAPKLPDAVINQADIVLSPAQKAVLTRMGITETNERAVVAALLNNSIATILEGIRSATNAQELVNTIDAINVYVEAITEGRTGKIVTQLRNNAAQLIALKDVIMTSSINAQTPVHTEINDDVDFDCTDTEFSGDEDEVDDVSVKDFTQQFDSGKIIRGRIGTAEEQDYIPTEGLAPKPQSILKNPYLRGALVVGTVIAVITVGCYAYAITLSAAGEFVITAVSSSVETLGLGGTVGTFAGGAYAGAESAYRGYGVKDTVVHVTSGAVKGFTRGRMVEAAFMGAKALFDHVEALHGQVFTLSQELERVKALGLVDAEQISQLKAVNSDLNAKLSLVEGQLSDSQALVLALNGTVTDLRHTVASQAAYIAQLEQAAQAGFWARSKAAIEAAMSLGFSWLSAKSFVRGFLPAGRP